jgi:ketosteroid isomerase-like protein
VNKITSTLGLVAIACTATIVSGQAALAPAAVANELLAADRAFSAASAKTDLISGLSAMFAKDIVLPNPAGIALGLEQAVTALRANPANAAARLEWTPVRAAISGDGRHGFTAGFMTMRLADGKEVPLKYLAYWEKQGDGWRVRVYKRVQAKVAGSLAPMPSVLPKEIVAPTTDEATIAGYRESLADAETSFSRDAQTLGMRAAFTQYGDPEAINLGGPDVATFLVGNQAIGAGVGGERPATGSPVSWGPERTIVAGSGDFGVTIGYIVPNAPGADGKPQPGRPFFTIWRRDGPDGVWRYIAE